MSDEERKIFALSSLIKEEFTDLQIRLMLANLLLIANKNNDIKAVEYLQTMKKKFEEANKKIKQKNSNNK